ncbi:MAG TPA: hypothetical protein VHZ25_07455 [Acidobacteriaceae bacterium]|jgi:hypothetical protein|nr:hypothetical protein [Acidobacteriaceae bacterium]
MLSDSNIRESLGPLDRPPDPNQPPPSPPRTGLLVSLVVLLVLVWGGSVALLFHFERTSPSAPDAATHHVARFSDFHRIMYLTPGEQSVAWGALIVPLLGTIAVAIAGFRLKPPSTGDRDKY